jgi:hypothetical protein
MTDPWTVVAAVFSAIATALAAFATWQAPRGAARLAEDLRRDYDRSRERQQNKLHIFARLMQERASIYSENGVGALNLIDVVFYDSIEVRDAWAELFSTFSLNPMPSHVMEERLRRLLSAMAKDIGLGDGLRMDDLSRVYIPNVMAQERLIRDMQRQQALTALQTRGSPAANTTPQNNAWPPKPE